MSAAKRETAWAFARLCPTFTKSEQNDPGAVSPEWAVLNSASFPGP